MKNILFCCLLSGGLAIGLPAQHDSLVYELYRARIALAEANLELNEVAAARAQLNLIGKNQQGWEWRLLDAALDNSVDSRLFETTVSALAFAPDGKTLAAAQGRNLSLHPYPTGAPTKEWDAHTDRITCVVYSPNGQLLASGARDKTVKIWDAASGQRLRTITEGLSRGIYDIAFHPDGQRLAVVTWELTGKEESPVIGFCHIYDVNSGRLLRRIDLDNHPAAQVKFTPDGQHIVIATWGEIAYCYQTETGRQEWLFDLSTNKEYNAFDALDISPDGAFVLLGGKDFTIRLLDRATGQEVYHIDRWQGHRDNILAVRFSADGGTFASAGEDNLLMVWSTVSGERLHIFRGHMATIADLVFDRQSGGWLTASEDKTVKTWQPGKPGQRRFDVCDNGPWYAPVSADGRYMAAACSDTVLGIWDIASGQRVQAIEGVKSNCAAFHHNGKLLAAGGHDQLVRVWDWPKGQLLFTLEGHTNSVFGMAFFNKKDLLATAGDSTLRLWNLKTGTLEQMLSFPKGGAYAVAFTPDEKKMVVGLDNGQVQVFDTETWQPIATLQGSNTLTYLCVSPDGRWVATSSNSGEIWWWSLENYTVKSVLKEHTSSVWGLTFSPDSSRLLSCSYDQTVRAWDVASGQCTLQLRGFENRLFKIETLGSTDSVLITETEGVVHVWQVGARE